MVTKARSLSQMATGVVSGSASAATLTYNGLTQLSAAFDGSTTAPSHTVRLNYDGNLYVSSLAVTGTTKAAGMFDAGTTAPTNTNRLNFDGYLYATRFYGDGSQLTGIVSGPSSQTLTDGATISWNVATGSIATVTLGAAGRTMAFPTNLTLGSYILKVVQDATGSRTITTWTGNYKWAGGTAPILSTAANALDVISFVYDGTNMIGSYIRGVA